MAGELNVRKGGTRTPAALRQPDQVARGGVEATHKPCRVYEVGSSTLLRTPRRSPHLQNHLQRV